MAPLSSRDRRSVAGLIVVLLVANILLFVWGFEFEGWRVGLYALVTIGVAWSVINLSRAVGAVQEDDAIFKKADALRQRDPEAAQDLLDSYFIQKAELAARERTKQWELAARDPAAAKRLERLLEEQLQGYLATRKRLIASASPGQRQVATELADRVEHTTREDLERVRALLQQLQSLS